MDRFESILQKQQSSSPTNTSPRTVFLKIHGTLAKPTVLKRREAIINQINLLSGTEMFEHDESKITAVTFSSEEFSQVFKHMRKSKSFSSVTFSP